MDAEDVYGALESAGHQVTEQRRLIVRRCLAHGGHFTAEDLFEQKGDGTLSRATVYNTLQVLVDVGFLRKLDDMGSASVYEAESRAHPHGRCRSCGRLIDLPVDLEREVDRWDVSFEVESVRMTLEGLCRDCAESETPAAT